MNDLTIWPNWPNGENSKWPIWPLAPKTTMKTTLKTTIALALMSLIIGCGEQDPEHTQDWKTELYVAGYQVSSKKAWLEITERPAELASKQAEYQELMRVGDKLIEQAVADGVRRGVAEEWYQSGLEADIDPNGAIELMGDLRAKHRERNK